MSRRGCMYAEGGIGIVSSTEQKSVIAVKANSNREEERKRGREEEREREREGEVQEEWRNDDGLSTTAPHCGSGSKRAIRFVFASKRRGYKNNAACLTSTTTTWAGFGHRLSAIHFRRVYSTHICSPAARMPPVPESLPLPGNPR